MRLLLTGPSCSGKTTICRANQHGRRIHLDQVGPVDDWIDSLDAHEHVVFEGLPSGSDQGIAAFRDHMDQVIVLAVPFGIRLARMIARDGPEGLGRFLYNEFAWNTYLAASFAASTRVVHLPPEQAHDLVAQAVCRGLES